MDEDYRQYPRLYFYLREPVPGTDKARYSMLREASLHGNGMAVRDVPRIGDMMVGIGPEGPFRVRDVMWKHAQYGSMYWPLTERVATLGPGVDIIVERCDGLFADELDEPVDEES